MAGWSSTADRCKRCRGPWKEVVRACESAPDSRRDGGGGRKAQTQRSKGPGTNVSTSHSVTLMRTVCSTRKKQNSLLAYRPGPSVTQVSPFVVVHAPLLHGWAPRDAQIVSADKTASTVRLIHPGAHDTSVTRMGVHRGAQRRELTRAGRHRTESSGRHGRTPVRLCLSGHWCRQSAASRSRRGTRACQR